MNAGFIAEAVRDLTARFGADSVMTATEGGRTLLQIREVELYPGCQPSTTPILLVLDPAQPKPIPYVRPGQLLANGKAPRSTSITMVGGEPWMQFSFNIPWEEQHGMLRFIAAARQRFAQNE
jgi:hypothetical protein